MSADRTSKPDLANHVRVYTGRLFYDGSYTDEQRWVKAEFFEALRARLAVETTAERWKERAVEAEGILSHNMALANATTRRAMNERNDIIRKLRERHSAIEIADMVGLTRQRVHQILNESPDEGASETPPVHTYTCTSCFTDAGQPHRPGCRNIEIDARQVKTACDVRHVLPQIDKPPQ